MKPTKTKSAPSAKPHKRTHLEKWKPAYRELDPLQLLRNAQSGRLVPLIRLKYERMSASPFGFFRGAAPVMAYDLSLSRHSGIHTQLCGDAHVQNLGAFCGPDGKLLFDINDFDETIPGPFEWDIKRLATSILLAGRDAKIKPADCESAASSFLQAYCTLIRHLATLPVLEVARYQVHRIGAIAPISEILQNAERSTPQHSLEHLTENSAHGRRFKSQPPLLRRIVGDEAQAVIASLQPFQHSILPERRHFLAQFRPIDVAFKVVGTGSVGLRDYCVYMEGNGPADPLFLQIKQEAPSAYAPYLPASAAHSRINQGQRVAEGQRAMQLQSDPLLGWTSLDGRDYLVRQLNDHKASVDITTLKAPDLIQYAEVCGELLARGHARAGDVHAIAAYIGKARRFTHSILDFADAYAVQTVADWKQLIAHQKKASASNEAEAELSEQSTL